MHAKLIRRTVALALLGLLATCFTVQAQSPIVEAANSNDEAVLQIHDDGGFVATDASNTGSIPASGAGRRMMWYPEAYAFRAGRVFGTQWDAANVGNGSVALGSNTTASGSAAIALGSSSTASGPVSFAAGVSSEANGDYSIAMGYRAVAGGYQSVAIGDEAEANDRYALALGSQAKVNSYTGVAIGWKASTGAANQGGMVLSADYTASGPGPSLQGTGQFAANARHFWFGDNASVTYNSGHLISTSSGAYLTDGGTWTNSSDSTKKAEYRPVDGENVLQALRDISVQTWSYKAESESVRHMGPTAQDFHAAFGLGDSEKAISTVDIDGVNMRAIQALEQRTRTLKEENEALEARVARLEEAIQQQNGVLAGFGGYGPVALLALAMVGAAAIWRRRSTVA
ncbi:hypothetical protein CRI94_15035 [Longibacter salinarum]|uniref:Peptidase S74 domain-containing protein n=1 Tax=Longibacter salinarum TaxID=1850348 RepID=A0A2A8CUT5_9BACT|nr:tail fiber domain-containing protein [Longibacter salinarum]PEN12332.1 hypothetical protein CRI94_15035 [Longibacter salinarum]